MYFSPGADRVALMFALDQSGSLREIISQQQEAALALFSRFGERSSVAVLRFSDTSSLAAPFTKDLTPREPLSGSLRRQINGPRYSTPPQSQLERLTTCLVFALSVASSCSSATVSIIAAGPVLTASSTRHSKNASRST